MRLLSVLLALLPLAAARCYPSNERQEKWNDKQDAFRAVKNACKTASQNTFQLHEARTLCVPGARGQGYEFFAVMDQDPAGTGRYKLEYDECLDRYNTNVDSCERGGVTNNKYMSFTLVPKRGGC